MNSKQRRKQKRQPLGRKRLLLIRGLEEVPVISALKEVYNAEFIKSILPDYKEISKEVFHE